MDNDEQFNWVWSYKNGECKIHDKITGERLYDAERQNDIDSQKFDADMDFINHRFPDAKFTICFTPDEIKERLSDESQIVVKQTFICYCHDTKYTGVDRPQSKFYVINNAEMTVENILDELIKQNMTVECNHQFLERILKQTDAQYELQFGS